MYRALFCLTQEHEFWTVLLAALVCWTSCHSALGLLQQARDERTGGRIVWLAGASLAAGIGIWTTHFIAMLGYDPSIGVGYDPPLTLLSLAVAVATACLALTPAWRATGPTHAALAGILFGLGVAAMHFTGMAGVRVPGSFHWNAPLVVLALVVGCALAAAALALTDRSPRSPLGRSPFGRFPLGRSPLGTSPLGTSRPGASHPSPSHPRVLAATLLTGAIAGTHFLAMAAAEVVPGPARAADADSLPRAALAVGIAAGMLTILAFSALALFAERQRWANRTLRERETALQEKTRLLDAVLESMDQGLMMVDAHGVVRVCNERAIRLLDLPAAWMRAQPTFEAVRRHQVAQGEFAKSPELLRQRMAAGGLEHAAHTYERERPTGTVLEIRTVPRPDGSAVRTYTDTTARKRAEMRTVESEARLALALDAGSDGLWDCDLVTGAVWSSDRWWQVLGYEPGELEAHARTWRSLLHPDDAPGADRTLADHLEARTATYECEHRLRRRDGAWAWMLTRGRVVSRAPDGTPLRFVGTQIDVGARKAAEGRIAHMARHDALTDLPNRALFHERLAQRLAEVRRYGGSCAVLCLDLDRFKAINDTLGHLAGDAMLCAVAGRLRLELRPEDTVARLGGDEFAVLLGGTGEAGRVARLAERLVAAVQEPVPFGEQRMEVGLSIGIALVPEHGASGEEVFKRADLALDLAKAEGRNTHRFFEPAMDAAAAERRGLEGDLRRAIAADELTLYYQPQVSTESGVLTGFEALVRWMHPVRGLISPASFIPLAEESGLIVALGEWVLRTACHEAARWTGNLKVAVNLSPRQFHQADLPERVLAILAETGLSPTRLELEITESVIINDMAHALGILRRLKAFGISIAMDDFGTGYSSLATLQAFPFDKIKIDRSFVGRVEDNAGAAVIVRAVLGLGRSLGMGVVAEGVETRAQLRFLTEEACDEVQGYLLGRPQPIEVFADAVYGGGVPTWGAVPSVA